MSFSKARIQRFNEFGSDVPPPGSYDPKFDVKIKGLVIEKTDRFNDTKSAASAECNLSVSSKSTGNPATTFRTPQLPRKKLTLKQTKSSGPKVKPRSLISSTDQKLKYNSEHELADLQVECINKDKTIQEQEKDIEEMKEELLKLELELEELNKKQQDVEEQHRKDIEAMAKLQQDILTDHDEKHQAETEFLRCQLLQVSEEKEHEIEARKTMEGELRARLAEFSERITILEIELENKKKVKETTIEDLRAQIAQKSADLEKIKEDHENEISLLETEKSQLNSRITEFTDESSEIHMKLETRQKVILELQAQLSGLQCELDELKAEHEKLIEDSATEKTDLVNKYHMEMDDLRDEFEKEKEVLESEVNSEKMCRLEAEETVKAMNETNAFLQKELTDVQTLYKDLSNRLKEAHDELEIAEKKHSLVLKRHQEDLDDMRKLHDEEKTNLTRVVEETKLDSLQKLKNLSITKDKEIAEVKEASAKKIEEEMKRVKDRADKLVENAEAVTRDTLAACRAESDERVKRVIAESDAKVNLMIREARMAVEEDMRFTAERYKACLARVEMERAALDEKLAHKDAEITRLSATLEELKSSAETQESFGQSLQMELDRAEAELAEKREELRALKAQIRLEAAEMVARKKRFEVVMAENQASVAALSSRLAQSSAEVERLQNELKRGEDCINEHRDLLSIMRNNSQMVHEQVRALTEQLDVNKGLVGQMESDSITKLESIKTLFEAKLASFKQFASKEISRLQEECETKTAQNTEMKNHLREMAERLTEAQAMLLKLEERNDNHALEVTQLEVQNSKLEQELKAQKANGAEMNKSLETQCAQQKADLDEAHEKIQELSERVKILEEKAKYAEESDAMFEQEKAKWKSFEKALLDELEAKTEETAKLKEHNKHLVKDHEEMSQKYAEVVGHHNHRQKIKHVSQLKDKINQLEQELLQKARVIEQQQKTIDKFKAEEKRAHSKGKENTLGLSKTAHSTPISSPHKPLTPLRSRNE